MHKVLIVTLVGAVLTSLRVVSGLIIAKVVAVNMGPSGIALLGQIQNLMTALNGVAAAPGGSSIIRYTAENKHLGFDNCAPWWRASAKWIFVLLASVIPLVCAFSHPIARWIFGTEIYYWAAILAALTLPLTVIGTLGAAVMNGLNQHMRFAMVSSASIVAATVLVVLLVIEKKIDGAIIGTVIFTSVSGAVVLIASLRQPWLKLRYWCGKTEQARIRDIGAYILMAMTSATSMPLALLIVRNILIDRVGWEAAGHWQAVWKISEIYLSVIGVVLSTYFLPRLASLAATDSIEDEIKKISAIVLPVVAFLALGVFLSRDIAISIAFTEAFRPARDFFLAQLIGDVLKIWSMLYVYPMLSRGAAKWYISTEISFSAAFVVLNYMLIPKYGVYGATMAYVFSYLVYLLFLWKNVKNYSR